LFSYSSIKSSADDDPTTITAFGNDANFYSLSIKPTLSYFVMDKLSIDAVVDMTKRSQEDWHLSYNIYGAGVSYFMNNNYLGAGYAIAISKSAYDEEDEENKSSIDFLELHGGYLHKLSKNVYLDLNASYLKGLTETDEYDNETNTEDSEVTMFKLNIGIKAFFKLK